jgi:hypothetical protein
MFLGMGFSQNNDYEPPSLLNVEIIPYRIYPSSNPTMGCWSELELMGESQMSEEVRSKLINMIIKIELYNEISEYIVIDKRSYFLLRLSINEFYLYNSGEIK